MVLTSVFPGNPHEETARALYEQIVAQTRQPGFYLDWAVPDSVDGRFDLLLLHTFLVLHRIKGDEAVPDGFGQTLFDLLFFDLDQSVRVSGVGDLKAGSKIKQMAQAFYGRVAAYDSGLAGSDEDLRTAVRRNLYGTVEQVDAETVAVLADYLRHQVSALAAQPTADLLAGRIDFAAPPQATGPSDDG